jgi:Family of unknown function (DUF6665)
MTEQKTLSSIEHEIAGEKAGALGRSGRKLRAALDNLQRFDRNRADRQRADSAARDKLVRAASDAFWLYVVQREAIGLNDSEYIRDEYGVPAEVWRRTGPR